MGTGSERSDVPVLSPHSNSNSLLLLTSSAPASSQCA